ncbi:MAG: glycerol 3-phosphate dehydrogenase [Bacteroidota bacterium]|jgi:glycerol-3-phosphate dehydrogenase (NAD(P)+)
MNIGVVGAGGWGTALANVAASNGHAVRMWSRSAQLVKEINNSHTNSTYLNGVTIHESIAAGTDPQLLHGSDIMLVSVPTQFIRTVLETYDFRIRESLIANASKGIENKTLLRVSQLLKDVAKIDRDNYAVLTGPSHAEEVIRGVPTTILAASSDEHTAVTIQSVFSNATMRVYRSNDVIGAELGGALKNVIAIAAGIIDGLGTGDNTKAALITRGLAEITRLGVVLGANPATFSGLSGLGDLIVTCDSRHSRNRHVGEAIGKGKSLKDILAESPMIAEGVATTESAYELAQRHGVEMPIVEQVYQILFFNKSPRLAIHELMTRESKSEVQ